MHVQTKGSEAKGKVMHFDKDYANAMFTFYRPVFLLLPLPQSERLHVIAVTTFVLDAKCDENT
jgi:hypothetical protein